MHDRLQKYWPEYDRRKSVEAVAQMGEARRESPFEGECAQKTSYRESKICMLILAGVLAGFLVVAIVAEALER